MEYVTFGHLVGGVFCILVLIALGVYMAAVTFSLRITHKEKGDYLFLPVIGAIVVAVISVILVGSAITTEKELRLSAPCLRMQEAGLHECPQICPEQSIEQSTETVSGWE